VVRYLDKNLEYFDIPCINVEPVVSLAILPGTRAQDFLNFYRALFLTYFQCFVGFTENESKYCGFMNIFLNIVIIFF